MIACILVRYFAAAVELRERPALAGRPLLIARAHGRQERVYAASADASDVQPGMKLAEAQTLCPEAQIVGALISRYTGALGELVEALEPFSDKREVDADFQRDVAIYLDLGRLKPSDALELGEQMRAACAQLKLPASVGFAGGKFTAFVAAVSTTALRLVPPDAAAAFLAPLPVALLPLDGTMERELWLLGIERLGQFAALPRGAVLARFGKRGRLLHDLAAGRDGRLLRPYIPPRHERAMLSFESPVDDRQVLDAALVELSRDLAGRLERGAAAVQQIVLLLHLDGGSVHEDVLRLRQPLSGASSLARVLCRALERARIAAPVAALEVVLEQLSAEQPRQLSLFEEADQQERQDRAGCAAAGRAFRRRRLLSRCPFGSVAAAGAARSDRAA